MRLLCQLATVYISLLCADAWRIPFFTTSPIKDGEITLHPKSPKERDSDFLRAKRQAYQVYVGDDVSVTIDKLGRAESGSWGHWTGDQQCSRTCGGGVHIEKRQCNSGDCTGPSVRYVSCNMQECPPGSKDFRAEQCSKHDDTPLDGNYYKWLPYPGKNKCELTCKPDNAAFYYKWADKVVDGTKCDAHHNDICVEGVCLPLGCDMKLGSSMKDDACGVCGGDGSTCKTIEGFFDERNLSPGYHDIIKLPAGSTSIRIEEMRSTSNSLAIKNSSDYYYLNGNYQIQVLDRELEIAGAIFEYDNNKGQGKEMLVSKGPIKENLIISLLFQTGNKDSAIKYEFSVPLGQDIPYIYKPGEWSSCSVTCGKGIQTRTPFCVENKSEQEQRVNDELCEEHNATKPEIERLCETVDCEAEWFKGEWEPCSSSCGDTGSQYRVVYCHKVFSDGKRMTVEDSNCTSERPPVQQSCARFACPEWHAGPWSACSEKCGDAFQYRSVTCRSEKEGEEGKLLPAEACGDQEMESQRSCNLGPCEGLKFFTTEWKLCEKCNDTEETRNVTCKDKSGRAYPLEKCLNDNTTKIPIDTRACATAPPCIYEWHASEWSKCSTECGHGHNTRRVVCAIHQLGDLTVVDESHCTRPKPELKKNCTNEEKCNGTYYTGPWSQCSASCDGGKQTRMIVCLNYDKKPVPEWCDEADKPAEEQECNVDPCPTCGDSEYGCCPDNTTFAEGPYMQGCSNCSTSEFGCCTDNVTEASGPNGRGCLEYAGAEEGSGEESTEEIKEDEGESCEVTDEKTGETAKVDCKKPKVNETVDDEEIFGNVTSENVTVHCSKSKFGCCPDWSTPAEGKYNAGCPVFVQGACNETANGCCPDNVTLARGPNFEGCGEPTCAASLYGCCKDRKTIAFGPHYAGCERSSFPCEISTYGCCPDGETAALGKNATGCGANCLLSKFGCCPDGVSLAKGLNNEGCGCEFAQYGCCPDGKTSAKGTGYYGCPESCSQSQYGCCPDGKTAARGANKEGCPCQYTRYGCCPDGETTALGPRNDGCDDCRYAKHGCCPDGETRAVGPNYAGCPSTTAAPFIFGGTVAPGKIVSCSLPQDQGKVCHPGYKLVWFYDSAEGRCSQFWYGGCEGNDNRFATKEQCETTCVDTPGTGRCYLPKIEGPMRCNQLEARYWYDYTTKQCGAFWWRGCLGNANNFASWEECQNFCSGVGPFQEPTYPAPYEPARSDIVNVDPHAAGHGGQEEPRTRPTTQPIREPERERQEGEQQPYEYPSIDEICRMTVDSGPCSNYETLWYYDAYYGSCHQFTYSGCGGNLNKFQTKEECEARCGHLGTDHSEQHPNVISNEPSVPVIHEYEREPSAHTLPQYVGHTPRPTAYYVPASPVYNIPGGAEHVVPSPAAHQPQAAIRTTEISPTPRSLHPPGPSRIREYTKSRDACNERMDVGRCKGSFESFYYEKATGTCESFQYSGCGGTANRFHTKQQCEDLCLRSPAAPSLTGRPVSPSSSLRTQDSSPSQDASPLSVCEQAKDTGPCDQYVTKWYYNKVDGTCNRFHYGGCQGTANRFESEMQCKNACGNYADACSLPRVKGPCSGKHQRFYYDGTTRTCEPFEFGGCLGNTNNFMTLEECEKRCMPAASNMQMQSLTLADTGRPLLCSLPKEAGRCRAAFPSYYYDARLGQCAHFIYGGCEGNENRFETYEECRAVCKEGENGQKQTTLQPSNRFELLNDVHEVRNEIDEDSGYLQPMEDVMVDSDYEDRGSVLIVPRKESSSEQSLDDFMNKKAFYPVPTSPLPELCMLPEDVGPCYGEILRWRYDSESSSCVTFTYKGCDHNANFFTSEEACERACGLFRDQDVCSLGMDTGPCTLGLTKWYYNEEMRECHVFMYSGCGGNGNRFSSKAECEHLCASETKYKHNETDVCALERDSGPCTDPVTQWYFDRSDEVCKQFTYGGCRGNQNRFDTKALCERRCSPRSQDLTVIDSQQVCSLPFEAGPCRKSQQKWYFDSSEGRCRLFIYGGCRGNANRFETENECMHACSSLATKFAMGRRATISSVNSRHSYLAGSTVSLVCSTHGQHSVRWFKNGREFDFEIASDRRIQIGKDETKLTISDARESDSGDYSCAAGRTAILSDPFKLSIERPQLPANCVDRGNDITCRKIVKEGLCTMARYGNFCCRACSSAGFTLHRR